jgi:hypothetical protein
MIAARFAALAVLALAMPAAAQELKLGSPAACALETDCFVQQLPDMDAGDGATDPMCGIATYDGHDGLDLRVRSMADVARGVDVVAAADGEVLRTRDGVADHLVMTAEDRAAIEDTECGNGVVIRHGNGYQTQYCHMREGSLVVSPGDKVAKGQKLGQIGASGLAQFPHVHLTLRHKGEKIDPTTGKPVGSGCEAAPTAAASLWDPATAPGMLAEPTALLGVGFGGAPLAHDKLVVEGSPAPPTAQSAGLIAWLWAISLRKGDTVEITLAKADGTVLASGKTEPLDRSKATYSYFVGKKQPPEPGDYRATATIWRDGKAVREQAAAITIP